MHVIACYYLETSNVAIVLRPSGPSKGGVAYVPISPNERGVASHLSTLTSLSDRNSTVCKLLNHILQTLTYQNNSSFMCVL